MRAVRDIRYACMAETCGNAVNGGWAIPSVQSMKDKTLTAQAFIRGSLWSFDRQTFDQVFRANRML